MEKKKKKEARRDGKIIGKKRKEQLWRRRVVFHWGRKNCGGTREKLVKIFTSMGIFGDDEARFTWHFFSRSFAIQL